MVSRTSPAVSARTSPAGLCSCRCCRSAWDCPRAGMPVSASSTVRETRTSSPARSLHHRLTVASPAGLRACAAPAEHCLRSFRAAPCESPVRPSSRKRRRDRQQWPPRATPGSATATDRRYWAAHRIAEGDDHHIGADALDRRREIRLLLDLTGDLDLGIGSYRLEHQLTHQARPVRHQHTDLSAAPGRVVPVHVALSATQPSARPAEVTGSIASPRVVGPEQSGRSANDLTAVPEKYHRLTPASRRRRAGPALLGGCSSRVYAGCGARGSSPSARPDAVRQRFPYWSIHAPAGAAVAVRGA